MKKSIKTDEQQYCIHLSESRYRLAEIRCVFGGFGVVSGIIDISDYDPAEIVPSYYGSIDSFLEVCPDEENRLQLFAEMCFESTETAELTLRGTYESEKEAEKALEILCEGPRLFIDMDGTLTTFTPATMSQLNAPGYFRNLQPLPNVIAAVRHLIRSGSEVYVLSAVLDNPHAAVEKRAWLTEYLPELHEDKICFVPCGADKSRYVPGGIRPQDILLDDYSRNLHLWKGCGVKLRNGINGTKGTWKGLSVCADLQPKALANILEEILDLQVDFLQGL